MNNTKSFTKRIMAILFVILTIVSTLSFSTLTAQAATSGSKNTRTITVNTKTNYWYPGASSITLKQEKITITWKSLNGKKTKKTSGYYGRYNISIYNVTDNKWEKSKCWNGKQSIKIELKGNKKYNITVSYDANGTWLNVSKAQPIGYGSNNGYSPNWWVSGSHKVTNYY